MRRLLTLIAAMCLGAATANAGDYADRVIIGFSPDGAYFAFEEYGVQDGSGFPYSSIYLIETATDSWVPGTPIRVFVDDETATLDSVRAAAYDQALPALTQYAVGLPGRQLVHNPITELTNPHNAEFLLRALAPLQSEGWSLWIDDVPLPSDCPDFGDPFVGFDLWLKSPSGAALRLNHDTTIPESRSCPLGYSIADVIAFERPQDTVLIVLLNLFRLGFEGPDRRFLAIATELSE